MWSDSTSFSGFNHDMAEVFFALLCNTIIIENYRKKCHISEILVEKNLRS